MQNKLDAATSFVDAGNAYKKADPQGENTVHNKSSGIEWLVHVCNTVVWLGMFEVVGQGK